METDKGKRIPARARDVSRTGVCLIIAEQTPAGSSVTVELVLSFGDQRFSAPLRLKTNVVWCTPSTRTSNWAGCLI